MTGWHPRGLLLPLYLSFLLLASAPGCAPQGAPVAVSPGTAGAGKGAGEPPVLVYVAMAGGDLAVFHLDAESGHLARRGSVSVGRSPSSLVRSADREVLIATDEATGTATAMAINSRTGGLRTVGRAATGGLQPTGATLDRTGHYLLVANRGSGNVSVLAIKTGGALEAIETFPAGVGADAVAVHPANDLAFVANLRAGDDLAVQVQHRHRHAHAQTRTALKLPPGSGPTRLVCHPSGRWVYILNETNDTIAAHVVGDDIRALSSLASQIVSTLPSGFPAAKSRPGDLQLGPKGRFLYATNRGHDSVVTFASTGRAISRWSATSRVVGAAQPRWPWSRAAVSVRRQPRGPKRGRVPAGSHDRFADARADGAARGGAAGRLRRRRLSFSRVSSDRQVRLARCRSQAFD